MRSASSGVNSVPSMKLEKYASQNGRVARRGGVGGQRRVGRDHIAQVVGEQLEAQRPALVERDASRPRPHGRRARRSMPGCRARRRRARSAPRPAPARHRARRRAPPRCRGSRATASAPSTAQRWSIQSASSIRVIVAGGRSPRWRVGRVLSSRARGREARCTPAPIAMSPSTGPGPLRDATVRPGSSSTAVARGGDEQVAVVGLGPPRRPVGDHRAGEPVPDDLPPGPAHDLGRVGGDVAGVDAPRQPDEIAPRDAVVDGRVR